MITFIVLDDEQKITDLISQLLRKEGYCFIDEPESKGLIKIIKKAEQGSGNSFDFSTLLLQENNGELYKATVEDIEKSLIATVLERTDGNQLKAAKILGINRNTLRTKVQKLGIDVSKWKVY